MSCSQLTQIEPFRARLALVILFAVVTSLALLITELAFSSFRVAIFPHGTFPHAVCKLQKIWRITTGAHIWFAKAGKALEHTSLAPALVIVETVSTLGHTPLGSVRAFAFHARILRMAAIILAKSTCKYVTQMSSSGRHKTDVTTISPLPDRCQNTAGDGKKPDENFFHFTFPKQPPKLTIGEFYCTCTRPLPQPPRLFRSALASTTQKGTKSGLNRN